MAFPSGERVVFLPLKVLIAAGLLAAAPVAALAQAWPAIAVASTPGLRAHDPRPSPPARARTAARPVLKLTRPQAAKAPAARVPEVDIRAKAAWSDDEGFRLSPTRLAFKRRF